MPPHVFDPILIIITQLIKAKTVFLRIDHGGKPSLKYSKLRGIQQAFKNRILYAYSVLLTDFRNVPETFLPAAVSKRHIVCYKYQHNPSLPKKRIYVKSYPQPSCKQHSLTVWNKFTTAIFGREKDE